MFLTLDANSFRHSCAHLGDFFPGNRCLKRLGDEVILEAEVSEISDHEGKEISSFSVLGSSPETFVLFGYLVNYFHLVADLVGVALEENSAESHLIRVEFHHFSHEKFLSSVDHLMPLVFFLSLQRHAKLELLIVHESQTSRPHLGLSNYISKILPSYMNLTPYSKSWKRSDSYTFF